MKESLLLRFKSCLTISLYTTRSDVHDLSYKPSMNHVHAFNTRHDEGSDATKAPVDEAGGLEWQNMQML
jgi:hypothetical protein